MKIWRFFLMKERTRLPFDNLPFYNKVMDKTAIKKLISRLIDHFGMTYTSHILDQLKTSGFQQATDTAISLGIDDLLTAPSKAWLVQDAEQQGSVSEKQNHYGNVHAVEKLRQSIEIWYATSEYLRKEMNPNFSMTDPLNPVHVMSFSGARGSTSQVHQLVGMRGLMSDPQGQIIDLPIRRNLREGLSLTEYIISCYGARKGVVDTAVRTADAGYLTRRLVEVVQHIVVRRKDCGTIQGIFVSPIRGRERDRNEIVVRTQILIGRVLADDVYINRRCIATRNQDIGVGLANQLINLRTQPIYIRTPFTCKSISRICQLCYGRSTTHNHLIELGEAVGIIAGQSIGEPGTQLTLRTFHTGGVFTGDIAEHVRAPFNGKIEFNDNLVYPTRTCNGHPAYLCHNNLSITIDGQDQVKNLTIPPQSLLLVQNDQYVESEQIIAEVRARTSSFKEKVRKNIYSDLEGEMHWSTNVCHAPEYVHGNVHPILRTGYLWILSGGIYGSGVVPFPFHKHQDQVDVQPFVAKHQSLSDSYVDQVEHRSGDSNCYGKEEQIFSYSETDRTISNEHRDSIYVTLSPKNYNMKGKRQMNRFIVPLQCDKEWGKRIISFPDTILRIPKSGVLQRNSIFGYSNVEYGIPDGPIMATSFSLDLSREGDNLQIQVSNSSSYEDGERIQVMSDTSIPLVQTCLGFDWEQIDSIESEAYASLTSVRTNKIVSNMIQISLIKYPLFFMGRRDNKASSNLMFHNKLDHTNLFYSNGERQLISKHQGTICSLYNGEEDSGSFMILSPSDCFRIVLFNDSKCYDTVNKSNREDPMRKIIEFSGLLGHLHSITNRFPSSHFLTYKKVLSKKHSIPKYYFMDENTRISHFDPCRNIISNLLGPNWCSSSSEFCKKIFPVVSPGQLIPESVCISEDEPLPESGQIIAVDEESLVIRSAKPYLATRKATVHGHYGEIIDKGDTLITLIYERFKSSDIIQGLPKVEQLSEARLNNSISMNLKESFENWTGDMTRFLGSLWGLFISARITMEQSQIHLVNQIQKVYRSQGVRICDKHIEIIVRQMTSKVLISEDGMANVFSPGELIGLSRAQRMDRALEEAIYYQTMLLGITRASLNTQSFISEASFQETARVLAKAALQGRIDWLKGLKENVILGGIIPAGTGQHIHRSGKRNGMDPRMGNRNLFSKKVKDIFFHYHKVSFFSIQENSHNILKQPFK
uniref:RNA polymerase beta'' subunit n=1 Tax=Picea brachytyla TaxID=308686 RepID=UPI002027754E|nr:RNA polymerase beta'' subunit [Picea brachytyla]YP_010413725.1 RNA polymerase beta'' subunit [Picea purpurea]UGW52796.1 RNA polymerase beta'' subunit [Picea brachytyla]URQ19278.1 RNA polymerase beta'' subunit [Picea purpurea]